MTTQFPITITGVDIQNAKTLTTQQATYLSQLANSGVDLGIFLLSDNKIIPVGASPANPPLHPYPYYNSTTGSKYPQYNGGAMIDLAKSWYAANNIDFTTALTQELQSVGINVATNGNVTVIAPDTPFSQLVAAAQTANSTGSNIPVTFVNLANSFDFGYATNAIIAFFTNPENSFAIQCAIDLLNYPIPTTNDSNGQNQLEQIYWAAYYLAQYPLKTAVNPLTGVTYISYSSSDCETILETLKALAAEKTNISSTVASNFYTTYTQNDYALRTTALTDLTSMFNLLDAKYNCTANAAAQVNATANSNLATTSSSSTANSTSNMLFYIVCGGLLLICGIVIVRKIQQRGGHFLPPKNNKDSAEIPKQAPAETTTTTTN